MTARVEVGNVDMPVIGGSTIDARRQYGVSTGDPTDETGCAAMECGSFGSPDRSANAHVPSRGGRSQRAGSCWLTSSARADTAGALNGTYRGVLGISPRPTRDSRRGDCQKHLDVQHHLQFGRFCAGTVTSDQGWSAEVHHRAGQWFVKRDLPDWVPCPDGVTTSPGSRYSSSILPTQRAGGQELANMGRLG